MSRPKGFSLIELIIAIAVLTVGLVGILQVFPVGLRASYRAGMVTKASFLAQNKIEEMKIMGFDKVAETPPKIALSGTEGDFDWKISIGSVTLDGLESTNDIRKITVNVSWAERGRLIKKDFITYIRR